MRDRARWRFPSSRASGTVDLQHLAKMMPSHSSFCRASSLRIGLAVAALAAVAAGARAAELDRSLNHLFNDLRRSVVAVEAYRPLLAPASDASAVDGFQYRLFVSSGILQENGRRVVTTASGVELGDSVLVRLASGDRIPADLHAEERELNVALLTLHRPVAGAAVPRMPPEETDSLLSSGGWVAALGYVAGDSEPILTIGRLTGLTTTHTTSRPRTVLRTNVPIFPGSSGGILVDGQGRWLGLIQGSCLHVSAGAACPEEALFAHAGPQVALALPVDEVESALERMRRRSAVSQAFLGVRIDPGEEPGAPPGLRIASILEDSPAQDAGLRSADRILEVNGEAVHGLPDLRAQIGRMHAGDRVRLVVVRNGAPVSYTIQLGDRRIYEQYADTQRRRRMREKQIEAQIRRLRQLLD
ncbi:MAG: PDZ domain-containing protein, partial [Candidatus Eisenbacteria bacterium]|nr:PDZ domain-containing protein [Candidatus Eisenbacteria bacterium]